MKILGELSLEAFTRLLRALSVALGADLGGDTIVSALQQGNMGRNMLTLVSDLAEFT